MHAFPSLPRRAGLAGQALIGLARRTARVLVRTGAEPVRTGLLGLGLALAGCGPAPASDGTVPPLAPLLLCRFQTVSVGQFHGLDYGPGAPSGSSTLALAASADDLRAHRAAVLAGDGTFVARIIPSEAQTLFVAVDPDGGSLVVSVFRTGEAASMPAILSRLRTIGSTPVIVQGAGSCRTEPG